MAHPFALLHTCQVSVRIDLDERRSKTHTDVHAAYMLILRHVQSIPNTPPIIQNPLVSDIGEPRSFNGDLNIRGELASDEGREDCVRAREMAWSVREERWCA